MIALLKNIGLIFKKKIKIVICGVNGDTFSLEHFIHENIDIVGFIEERETQQTYIANLRIISFTDIISGSIVFDYIVLDLCDEGEYLEQKLINHGIQKDKIINTKYFLHQYVQRLDNLYRQNYEHSFLVSRLERIERGEAEGIVLGLSYPLHGLVENLLERKCVKLTLPSQDLYFDYQLLRRAVNRKNRISHCIWGMAYYSFDYDMSYGSASTNIWDIYFPIVGDSHGRCPPPNYISYKGIEQREEIFPSILDTIFSKDLYRYAMQKSGKGLLYSEYDDDRWNNIGELQGVSIETLSEEERCAGALKRCNTVYNIDYPHTRAEYLTILTQGLQILRNNNIKTTIVVFPVTKYYSSFSNSIIKTRFYSIMNKLKENHEFQLIDLFDSNIADLNDFADWDHLNQEGAKKCTIQLNKLICW